MSRWARAGRTVGVVLGHLLATLAVVLQAIWAPGMTPSVRPDLPMPKRREEYRP